MRFHSEENDLDGNFGKKAKWMIFKAKEAYAFTGTGITS